MELTPRAHALAPAITRALAELQATITLEPAFDPRRSERLFRLGADDYTQAMLVPLLLAYVEQHAPGINLSIVHTPNLLELVDEGQVDLVTIVGKNVPSPLKVKQLFTEGFVCMVRKRHPSVSSKLTLSQYLGLRHLVVAPSGAPGSIVDTELEKRG